MAKLTEEQKQKRAETRAKNKAIKEAKEKAEAEKYELEKSLEKARRYREKNVKRIFTEGDEVEIINSFQSNGIVKQIIDEGQTCLVEYGNHTSYTNSV